MNASSTRRSSALLGGALLASSLMFAPAAAQATPVAAEENAGASCQVTGGTLTWGVKESFRSYISGTIANGSWDVADGASYETPSFQWSGGTGSIDPETGVGSVSFLGAVHFTGHDGVLDLTLANPTLEFEGDGKASLLLDARSTDASGEVTIDSKQEWVGDVEAPSSLDITDAGFMADAMPTTLTNGGAKAFAGFYEPGADLDPIAVASTFEVCDASGAPAVTDSDTAQTEAPAETVAVAEEVQVPWVPIVIGGVAVLVIGVSAGMLFAGRKRQDPTGSPEDATDAPASE